MIFSFYSYKGGVGRSQLCANVAAYLCHKRNKRILLLDWDFEAPGLHYYYNKKQEDLVQIEGSLELLERYVAMMLTQDEVHDEDYEGFEKEHIINLLQAHELDWGEETRGRVDLIPAGRYDATYSFRTNNFDWQQFYNDLGGQGYIEWLKGQFKQQLEAGEYDYILIDSRTGVNDYSGICNLHLPDANVVIMAANTQNMEGCAKLINNIITHPYTLHENNYRTKFILPVLSRINVNNPRFDEWSDEFVKRFRHLMEYWETELRPAFREAIFRDFYLEKTLLEDMPQYSAGENLLFHSRRQRIQRSSFAAKFANLAEYLENLKKEGHLALEEQIDQESWEYYAEEAELSLRAGKGDFTAEDVADAYDKAENEEKSKEYGGTVELYMEEAKEYMAEGKNEEAIKVLKKVLSIRPTNEEAWSYLGLTYSKDDQLKLAIESFQKAVLIKPDFHEAWNNLGNAYNKNSQLELAIESCQKAVSIKPNVHEAWDNLGYAYYNNGQLKLAIESYQKVVAIKPEFHEAWYNLGIAYYDNDQLKLAIESYQKAVAIKPEFHEAWNNLGSAYYKNSQLKLAIKFYQKAVTVKPDFHEAWHNLGVAYANSAQVPLSIASYQKAVAINSKAIEARKELIKLHLQQNQPQKAQQLLQELQQLEPQNPKWLLQLAQFHYQQKEWTTALQYQQQALAINKKEAIQYLKDEVKEDPQNVDKQLALGRLYQTNKDWGKALGSFEKALKLDPQNTRTLLLIGEVYSSKGANHLAIEYYSRSLLLDDQDAYAYYKMGNAYNVLGDWAAAQESYQQCLALQPDHMSALNNLGVVYHQQGQQQLAIETYLLSLQQNSNHASCNNNIGYLYWIQGNVEQARIYLYRARDLGMQDFAHRNLGHCELLQQQPEKALAHYRQSWEAFENKLQFWEGMEHDFKYLKINGVTIEDYEAVKVELLTWIEAQ